MHYVTYQERVVRGNISLYQQFSPACVHSKQSEIKQERKHYLSLAHQIRVSAVFTYLREFSHTPYQPVERIYRNRTATCYCYIKVTSSYYVASQEFLVDFFLNTCIKMQYLMVNKKKNPLFV